MGGTRSDPVDWGDYSRSSTTRTATFSTAYTNKSGVKDDFAPRNMKPLSAAEPHLHVDGLNHVKMRVSDKSDANPKPTPIIMALDCTGSMNDVALAAKKAFGTLMEETYNRLPVTDPAILCAFYNDVRAGGGQDSLQVTQFESDKIILEQMEKLYWTNGGGSNRFESYDLPLYFALYHTRCVAFDEGRKGFIFTMGDDGPPIATRPADIELIFGQSMITEEVTFETLVEQVSDNWHYFHLSCANDPRVDNRAEWQRVLGERYIDVPRNKLDSIAEIMVATMQVVGGADVAAVAASFKDPGTAMVVKSAIGHLTPSKGGSGGIQRL